MAPSGSAKKRAKKRVAHATGIMKLAKTGPGVDVQTAMKMVGFTSPEARNHAIRKQVYRKRDELQDFDHIVHSKEPAAESDYYSPTKSAMNAAEKHLRLKGKINKSGMQQTTRQAHAERKLVAQRKELRTKYFVVACKRWKEELVKREAAKAEGSAFGATSAETICAEIFEQHAVKIGPRAVRNYVKKNDIDDGKPPPKPGRKGRIPEEHYKILLEAVDTYCTISQAIGKKTINRPKLIRLINACVNAKEGAGSRQGRRLFERLQKDMAATLDISKPDRVENGQLLRMVLPKFCADKRWAQVTKAKVKGEARSVGRGKDTRCNLSSHRGCGS